MISIFKKILELLTLRERKRFYALFGVMLISGSIEVAGIASIMPFLSLITNPDLIKNNRIFNFFYTNLNFQNTNRYLIFIGIIVLIILIISNLLVFLTQYSLARFSWMRNYSISRRLLCNYLYRPYKYFLNRNTSLLGKNILSEVEKVVQGVVLPFLKIFSHGIVALLIFALLISIEPILGISLIFVLGGGYILAYRLIKQKLYTLGDRRYQTNAEQYKSISEAFGDIRQVKLRGCENFFINNYSKSAIEWAKNNAIFQVLGNVPRYIIEVIIFGGLIVVILYLLATAKGFQNFLPLIGLYAFASYRFIPSLQEIFREITNIRFFRPAFETLYKDMHSFNNMVIIPVSEKSKIKSFSLKKELKLEGITFSYQETKKPLINNLNIKIGVNTSVAFIGTTGSGKTTIANIILGLLRPDAGRILVDGKDINDENLKYWQRNLGYIPQDIYLQDNTVKRNIAFGLTDSEIDMDSVIRSAKIANIHDFIIEQLPEKYETVIGERGARLSGGQRQRIGIARAIYHDPGVLVLDEATSSLDSKTENEVFEAIENIAKTKTLIIITHRLTTIQGCDTIYLIEKGKIVGFGKYDELAKSNKNFRKTTNAHG